MKPRIDTAALIALFNAGRFAAVEPQARELVGQDPASGIGWKILGVALLMQHKDAVSALQRAAKLLPQDAEAHCNLGSARVDLGQFEAALKSCVRALQINPRLAEAHNNMGNALRGLGRRPAAVESYRRALALKPVFAEAHHNLGNTLHSLGEREAALASFREALAARPRFAAAHSSLGMQQDSGRFDEAVASFRCALQIKPDPEVHRRLGTALLHLGRPAEALVSYRLALELRPDARAHNDIGNALFDLERPDDAEASYRQALSLDPRNAEALTGIGFMQRRQHRAGEAQASCREALAIDPPSAAAHSLWGDLCADTGRFVEAEESFRRAAAIAPDLPSPWASIASVRRMTADDADWLREALRIAALPLAPSHQAAMCHAIGKYFDDTGDHPQAFLHYRKAHEITRPYRPKYDRQQFAQQVDGLIRTYDQTWVCRQRNATDASRPVFIVGMPRSGTSLAEQILASHPAIAGAGELPFWTTALSTDDADLLTEAAGDRILEGWARTYLRSLEDISAGSQRVVDKMPHNFACLGVIHAALPNARIIHMRRSPIDTCLSIYCQKFSVPPDYAGDLHDLAHHYSEYLRLMEHWRATLPPGVLLEVPYEELVAYQEYWSRRMLEFIGVPWDARCLDFHQTVRPVLTVSRWQVRQKMNSAATARWRNYYAFAEPLLRLESS